MLAPDEYSDTLRALGQFLDLVAASEIGIADDVKHVGVSWKAGDGVRHQRWWNASEIRALRTTVRLFRGLRRNVPPSTISELLRALGRELEEMAAESIRVVEANDGFSVRAQVRGGDFQRLYSEPDLVARVRRYRRLRQSEVVQGTPHARNRAMDRLILIVEDDLDIRDALSIGLALHGFRVATASDGIEGLQAIARERPALVLLDLQMPGLDGRALGRRLSKLHQQLPIIVLSGDPSAGAYAREIGAMEWLPKPFGFGRLLSTVKSVVELRS